MVAPSPPPADARCAGVTCSEPDPGRVASAQQARYPGSSRRGASQHVPVALDARVTQESRGVGLDDVLACPRCGHGLSASARRCEGCGHRYGVNPSGFLELIADDSVHGIDVLDATYALDQHTAEARVYERYLKPYLARTAARSVIDVGCGVGRAVMLMARDGYAAFGVDVPHVAPLWADHEHDPARLVSDDATALPFRDRVFDVALSRGVIEHIGTTIGHYTLNADYLRARRRFAAELLRVLRPGGRAVVACPNKTFPVDIQHGPSDGLRRAHPFRQRVYNRTGINVHRTWGAYHLLSFQEVERLFVAAGARSVRPLPIAGYFSFGRFQHGALRPFDRAATAYVNNLPRALWRSPLNPYVIAEIRV